MQIRLLHRPKAFSRLVVQAAFACPSLAFQRSSQSERIFTAPVKTQRQFHESSKLTFQSAFVLKTDCSIRAEARRKVDSVRSPTGNQAARIGYRRLGILYDVASDITPFAIPVARISLSAKVDRKDAIRIVTTLTGGQDVSTCLFTFCCSVKARLSHHLSVFSRLVVHAGFRLAPC